MDFAKIAIWRQLRAQLVDVFNAGLELRRLSVYQMNVVASTGPL